MAKSSLDITIDNKETFAMIEGLIRKVENPESLLKLIGRYIRVLTSKMFASGSRPDHSAVRGEKWPELKESTIFKKRNLKKRGLLVGNSPYKPLVETGRLRDDLISDHSIKIDKHGLEYGTNLKSKKGFPYPAIHQTGGKNVPQRRWLFLNDDELNQIASMTKEWLEGKK